MCLCSALDIFWLIVRFTKSIPVIIMIIMNFLPRIFQTPQYMGKSDTTVAYDEILKISFLPDKCRPVYVSHLNISTVNIVQYWFHVYKNSWFRLSIIQKLDFTNSWKKRFLGQSATFIVENKFRIVHRLLWKSIKIHGHMMTLNHAGREIRSRVAS